MISIPVVYHERQVADPGVQTVGKDATWVNFIPSPSAGKPREMAAYLAKNAKAVGIAPEFVEPVALTAADLKRCHDPAYVDNILALKAENGFGTTSQSVADSLPYTNGAMYTATKKATASMPSCALVSGFHHAGYNRWRGLGWFCTFNGLMATALKLIQEEGKRVAIVDCDMHWGNGTDDIIHKLGLQRLTNLHHDTFGRVFTESCHAHAYLEHFDKVASDLGIFKPDVIIYQAGADVHVDDPYGGILTEEQMYDRDLKMFEIAKSLNVPLAWNLAGGYQVDPDGSINKVLKLHMNTFLACKEIYGGPREED